MVVPIEQWASQPIQDKSADLWAIMPSDHNEKYSYRMEKSYKAFAVTFELRLPFPLRIVTWSIRSCLTGTVENSDLWSSSWKSYSRRRGKQVIKAQWHHRLSAVVHHHQLVVISVRSQVIEPGTAIKSHSVSNAVSRVLFQPSVVADPLRG